MPKYFYRRLLLVAAFGIICLLSLFTHLILDVDTSAYLLILMSVYLLSFASTPLFFRWLYPLVLQHKSKVNLASSLLVLLVLFLYSSGTLIYLEGIALGADPYFCYVLLILIAVPAGAAPLFTTVPLIIISNTILLTSSIEIFGSYFPVFLVGSQLVVLSLFRSLLSEFESRTLLEVSLAELSATQGILRDIVEQETKVEVARNLHDEIGHLVTLVVVNLNRLIKMEKEGVSPLLLETQQLTKQLMSEIRQVVLQLRSDDSVDLSEAIDTFAKGLIKPAISVKFQGFDGLCSARIGEVIFRTCQESVTNVMRHSSAETINIVIQKFEGYYQVEIQDDGRLCNSWDFGSGLKGLQERAEQLLGSFNAYSDDTGFNISLRLPY
jgi:signal transduction histidine kinase